MDWGRKPSRETPPEVPWYQELGWPAKRWHSSALALFRCHLGVNSRLAVQVHDPAAEPSQANLPLLAEIVVRPLAATLWPELHRPAGRFFRHRAAHRGRSMNLRDCHGKDVEVVLTLAGTTRTLRGNATYLSDPTLGNCLSVRVDDPSSSGAELLLREDEWTGRIVASRRPGCYATIFVTQNEVAP